MNRAFAVELQDKETGKSILIASGHISGCDPFHGSEDSLKGDNELQAVINLFQTYNAVIKVICVKFSGSSIPVIEFA